MKWTTDWPGLLQGASGTSAYYTVSVPVDRVHSNVEHFVNSMKDAPHLEEYMHGMELSELRWQADWDEGDVNSDPSSRFPYGA
jgi:hypothetical protein